MSIICDVDYCINNPKNYGTKFDPNGGITLCDKCFIHEVDGMTVDELMEVHAVLTNYLDNATNIEDILALPFNIESIIDDLMENDDVQAVAEAIKDKWTDKFNVMLKYRIDKEYG